MKRFLGVLFCLFILVFGISGCAVYKNFLGTSIKHLENKQDKEVKLTQQNIDYCYQQTLALIEEMRAEVFQQSKKKAYIVALGFDGSYPYYCIDTTEVGFFFSSTEDGKTRVEVSSLNGELEHYVAQKLFVRLQRN